MNSETTNRGIGIGIGTRVNYSGDMKNPSGRGAVTGILVKDAATNPPLRTFRIGAVGLVPVDTSRVYTVTLDDGREIPGIYEIPAPRGRGCADRFTLAGGDPADADEVARLKAGAVAKRALDVAAAAARTTALNDAKARALAEGLALGLVPEADFKGRGRAATWNLRAELKAAGIPARVKAARGTFSIDVDLPELTDEDTLAKAKAIAGKYKAGSFDGRTDSYDYAPSPWGRVFGDADYVFVSVDR